MIIEGEVSKINEALLYFEVNKTIVHLALFPLKKLPCQGTKVKVSSPFFSFNEFGINSLVLTEKNQILEGDFVCRFPSENNFLKLISKLKLEAAELLIISEHYNKIKLHLHSINHEDLIQSVIQVVPRTDWKHFSLKFISKLNFINSTIPLYPNIGTWNYCNHWNWADGPNFSYLLGRLYVRETLGSVWFSDLKFTIPCVITNDSKEDLFKFVEHYVLIKNYTIFTEFYSGSRKYMQYIMVDLNEIIPLQFYPSNKAKIVTKLPNNYKNNNFIQCEIIRKSTPLLNSKNSIECWLELRLDDGSKMYMCLNSTFSSTFPILCPNWQYKIYFEGPLNPRDWWEISSLSKASQCILPENAIFIPLGPSNNTPNYLNIAGADAALATNDLVTFQGKLTLKKFIYPLSSRTARKPIENFGTPGFDTHLLEFTTCDGRSLLVYLNNWESLHTPYGLLPNMELVVNNVISQKGTYFKSTIMTSFDVVKYDTIKFESANLFQDSDWGVPYYLGAGLNIPENMVIWGRVISIFINDITFGYYCSRCQKYADCTDKCKYSSRKCKENYTAGINLIATDQLGTCKITAQNNVGILLLKHLLGYQEPVFQNIYKTFKNCIKKFEFDGNADLSELSEANKIDVIGALTRHFILINECSLSLELKCRKTGEEWIEDDEDTGKIPCYTLLDVRKS